MTVTTTLERQEIVRHRPMPVLCLRHLDDHTEWLTTWRRLTALLFKLGLAGPHTTAVGVLYDLPWKQNAGRVRYDACLTLDPSALREAGIQAAFALCPGLRYEVIMGERPLARVGVRHSRRLEDMGVNLSTGALNEPSLRELKRQEVGLPLYEVYPCSPVFTSGHVPVVELYQTIHATDGRSVITSAAGHARREP